tara:strand:+ start:189 stop:347 length:159 start_codon:yes stop_codon:yes gene_type:complete
MDTKKTLKTEKISTKKTKVDSKETVDFINPNSSRPILTLPKNRKRNKDKNGK